MATRNVLDSIGNIIGTLTLPDDTTEDQWTKALSPYALINPPPPTPTIIGTNNKTASGQVTTSSSTSSVVGGMSDMPTAGKYIVLFSGSIYTDGESAQGEFGFYVDGALLPETRRDIKCSLALLGGIVTISLNAIGVGTYTGTEVQLNGSQTIDVRFKSNNGGTIGFRERVMTLLRVR